jgi:hypothetical protein
MTEFRTVIRTLNSQPERIKFRLVLLKRLRFTNRTGKKPSPRRRLDVVDTIDFRTTLIYNYHIEPFVKRHTHEN